MTIFESAYLDLLPGAQQFILGSSVATMLYLIPRQILEESKNYDNGDSPGKRTQGDNNISMYLCLLYVPLCFVFGIVIMGFALSQPTFINEYRQLYNSCITFVGVRPFTITNPRLLYKVAIGMAASMLDIYVLLFLAAIKQWHKR